MTGRREEEENVARRGEKVGIGGLEVLGGKYIDLTDAVGKEHLNGSKTAIWILKTPRCEMEDFVTPLIAWQGWHRQIGCWGLRLLCARENG